LSLDFQVLSLGDLDEVYAFAESQFQKEMREQKKDENETRLLLWHVPWRKEALEHYLKSGWSFIARDGGKPVGFYLAQPFLFFRGQTQTLWIEHIEGLNQAVSDSLLEIATKVAREKHLQRVLTTDGAQGLREIKTTKG
jgi:hypothetical protein